MIRKTTKDLLHRVFSMLLIVVLTTSFAPVTFAAQFPPVEQKTVRVGFFEFDGYHMEDENGVRSGYGYELMQKLATYNEWVYQYVGYDKSWSEMQDMLQNGEIDILTSAQKTPEREEKFDFSEDSIGTSATILTVKSGDSRYSAGDYSSYDKMRVGMIQNNSRNESFCQFADEHGFSYSIVYYDSTDELSAALQAGDEIDAVVTSNLRAITNEWILEQFSTSPFYAMVRKGDAALLEELDYAIKSLDNYSPGWRTELFNKYYQPDDGDEISFSVTERAYLTNVASNTIFKAIVNPDRKPYSYFENGQAKGIMVETFDLIAQRAGIQYTIVETADRDEYNRMIENGNVDIVIDSYAYYFNAEKNHYKLTDSYLTNAIARITRKDFYGALHSVAALQKADVTLAYRDALFAVDDVLYCDSLRACVAAVQNKQAACTYAYVYTAQLAIHEDIRNRLMSTVLPEYQMDFCIGVSNTNDHRLLAILNKAVGSISDKEIEEIVQQQTTFEENDFSIIGFVYEQPVITTAIIAFLACIIFLIYTQSVRIKHAEKQLLQAQELERFVGYVCSANDMVLEVNLNTMQCIHYYYVNGKVESRREPYRFAEYQNFDDHIDADDFEKVTKEITKERMLKAIEHGQDNFYFEARVQERDGVKKWFSYTLKAIPRDKLHPNNFIIFKKDINDTKQKDEIQRRALEDALETARRASMAKGQFLSRMSHEIRTPLNAVIGYMDIANSAKDNPEKMLHCVENSGLAARHLLNIINDVLDISSIESGKMKIAKDEFDLKRQITTVSTIFFNQAKAKNVSFDVIINGLSEEWVVGDSLRVNQILMNLLSNAVKFTQENGRITLTVTQINATDTQVFIKFEVRDTGIGMSQEYLNRLFKPFEQESAATAQKYGGTGLGLSITKNLVSMMRGSIDVKSKQNEGTTFVVSLCFTRAKQRSSTEAVPQDYSRIRVLVVDDEKSSCDYVKALLKRCGVKSDTVISGDAAIRQIKRRMGTEYAYDLCIMDWNMPGMDGVEATRRIRQECDPNIPIIIATAYDITEFQDEVRTLGVTKIISKPLFQSTMFDLLVSTYGKYTPVSVQAATAVHLKGLRVLLAEDNAMNQEIAVDILTKAEVIVDAVSDGQQAVDTFLSAPDGTYQAILMDIQMPLLNGYQATERIRASKHESAKTIPIIAMTANAFDEDISAAIASGMNDHISKPIDYDKLFAVLDRIMRKSEDKERGIDG